MVSFSHDKYKGLDHNDEIANFPKDYISSLKAYWEWRPKIAIERLTTSLALDTCPGMFFSLYRLWIEVLAKAQERESLQSLLEHLSFYVENESEQYETFAALKGMIHFELDEFEASKLVLRTVRKFSGNPFVWELSYRLMNRIAAKPPKIGFKKYRNSIRDYFHLRSYANAALLIEDRDELSWCYNRFLQIYPLSPFVDLSEFHGYLNKREFSKSIPSGRRLTEKFPLNIEFGFEFGYVLAQKGDYGEAIAEFSRLIDELGEDDPDVLNWLGYSMSRKAIKDNDTALKNRAVDVLSKSMNISVRDGIPISFPSRELIHLRKCFNDEHHVEDRIPRIWALKIDPQQYYRIRTCSEEEIRFMETSVNEHAKAGDICFVFGDDYSKAESRWRFGALFKIESDAIFSPLYKFINQLSLVNRPEVSIPLAIKELDSEKKSNVSFELSADGLDAVVEAMSDYLEGESLEFYQKLQSA